MQPVVYEGIEIDRCTNCKGIFFDLLEADDLKGIAGSESIDIGDPKVGSNFDRMDIDVRCPKCNTLMQKKVDVDQPHIWYEKCPNCYGIWFDAGEFKNFKKETMMNVIKGIFRKKRKT